MWHRISNTNTNYVGSVIKEQLKPQSLHFIFSLLHFLRIINVKMLKSYSNFFKFTVRHLAQKTRKSHQMSLSTLKSFRRTAFSFLHSTFYATRSWREMRASSVKRDDVGWEDVVRSSAACRTKTLTGWRRTRAETARDAAKNSTMHITTPTDSLANNGKIIFSVNENAGESRSDVSLASSRTSNDSGLAYLSEVW